MRAPAARDRPGGGPSAEVRERLRTRFGETAARALPPGYQRLGSVLLLRLPESLRPAFPFIGEAFREVLGVEAVLRRSGPVAGEFRAPGVETIAGGPTETIVVEHGVRYRFDAARILFARGNRTERHRIGRLVRPGETVVDLFAGIGYFALPALVTGRAAQVHAVEKNPVAYRYLLENLRLNRVDGRARPWLGDNRDVVLPKGQADRVVLGYLPDARPWVDRALRLLRHEGGALHVHRVVEVRAGEAGAIRGVRAAIDRAGGSLEEIGAREVKPYGPGRTHWVVDARARPGPNHRS